MEVGGTEFSGLIRGTGRDERRDRENLSENHFFLTSFLPPTLVRALIK